jgi:uncharacterized membrane protein
MQLKIYKNLFNSLFIRKVALPSLKNTCINLSAIIILLFISPTIQYGQASALVDNTLTPMTTDNLPGVVATSSTVGIFDEFSPKDNVTDVSLTNSANFSALSGNAWIDVKDDNATGGNFFPAGSYAGVVIENDALLALFGSFTVETYITGTGTAQESIGSASLISTGLLSGQSQVGFITTKNFDRIRFHYSALVAPDIDVFYFLVQKFGSGAALNCNAITSLNNPSFPSAINDNHTGTTGVSLSQIVNPYNVISPSTSDAAVLTPGILGVLTTTSLAVQSQIGDYSGIKLAGFEFENTSLLGANLLQYITINTYLDGTNTPVQTATGDNLLLSAALLQGSGRQKVSLLTTLPFDEIQIQFSIPAGVDLQTTSIYNAFIENFCARTLPFTCNTLTSLVAADNPIYINNENTAIGGTVCTVCKFFDFDNVMDGNLATYATLDLTAAVGSIASLSVRNALEDYPANTFAGYDIEINELLGVNVATGIDLNFYNEGSLVHTASNPYLLAGVGTDLSTGRIRNKVGVICPVAFDEVQISFENVVGVSLGEVRIYDLFVQTNCAKNMDCGTTYSMTAPDFPLFIDFEKTGVTGAACVVCEVENPWNLIDDDLTNYSRINTVAGALAESGIAILDPVDTYYPGTRVGFTVRNIGFPLAADVLPYVTIQTFNNGVLRESKNAGTLLDLTAIVLLINPPPGGFYNIGFEATLPFDEVKIIYGGLAVVNSFIEIYGAFIDNSNADFIGGANPTICFKTNPDFNVGTVNLTINGDVSTNDIIDDSPGEYSNPVEGSSNPLGGVLMLNSDGSYTFTSPNPGVYIYTITVCGAGETTNCRTEQLTITIKDELPSSNPPTANTDIATVTGDDTNPGTVIIPVLNNDEIGNVGGTLGDPTIINQPDHGTVVVNMDGTISYIPDDGYYGVDVFTYEVCESPGGLCTEATVVVTVLPTDMGNTTAAADDFVETPYGISTSGNVSSNDTDPEGNSHSVNPQNVTLPEGIFILMADGSYTFEPASGFFGSVDVVYVTCDNGTPSACVSATLHILVLEAIPLPTVLVSFDAKLINCKTQLNWKTLAEDNLKNYELEMSTDGINYDLLTTVEAKGVNGKGSNYSYSYTAKNGTTYYRLKSVDLNSSYAFSNVAKVTKDCGKVSVNVYPNPSSEMISIDINNFADNDMMMGVLYNLSGAEVSRYYLNNANTQIRVSDFTSGVYYLKVSGKELNDTIEVVIK